MGLLYPENHSGKKEEKKMVKVRINGREYSLSMEEFAKFLLNGMNITRPVDVLDMKEVSA